jgi:phenylacetate-CoA ligase
MTVFRIAREASKVRRHGLPPETQCQRLAELVAHARSRSPYYRRLYSDLPAGDVVTPQALPTTSKRDLMASFDDWSTDREITLERARAFVADPELAGTRFLGKYTVVATSGTTGTPAIFVKDAADLAVNFALSLRMMRSWLTAADLGRIVRRGGRVAIVAATGGHFLVAAGTAAMRRNRLAGKAVRLFSVHLPLAELVRQLNDFQPAIVLGYGSVLAMLAGEQEAARLAIRPVLLEPAGESISQAQQEKIAAAFGAKVRLTYGASECPYLTDGCEHGWYHVNSDWVVLEPVEADLSPTPVGRQSHSVLVTNLANRVQPIIRYDLGDSVLRRPDPCPCGNPLPAVRVRGRAANLLMFGAVSIPPLAFGTLVDRVPGVELFQVVQVEPERLRVRLRTVAPGADAEQVWDTVLGAIRRLLADHGLDRVVVERASEVPEQSAGGKYRPVVPYEGAQVPR